MATTRSVIQELVLECMADKKARTPAEIREDSTLLHKPQKNTLQALVRKGHLSCDESLEPTTYRITQEGLSALEAQNTKG